MPIASLRILLCSVLEAHRLLGFLTMASWAFPRSLIAILVVPRTVGSQQCILTTLLFDHDGQKPFWMPKKSILNTIIHVYDYNIIISLNVCGSSQWFDD